MRKPNDISYRDKKIKISSFIKTNKEKLTSTATKNYPHLLWKRYFRSTVSTPFDRVKAPKNALQYKSIFLQQRHAVDYFLIPIVEYTRTPQKSNSFRKVTSSLFVGPSFWKQRANSTHKYAHHGTPPSPPPGNSSDRRTRLDTAHKTERATVQFSTHSLDLSSVRLRKVLIRVPAALAQHARWLHVP